MSNFLFAFVKTR